LDIVDEILGFDRRRPILNLFWMAVVVASRTGASRFCDEFALLVLYRTGTCWSSCSCGARAGLRMRVLDCVAETNFCEILFLASQAIVPNLPVLYCTLYDNLMIDGHGDRRVVVFVVSSSLLWMGGLLGLF
jgi:hypothetical protein